MIISPWVKCVPRLDLLFRMVDHPIASCLLTPISRLLSTGYYLLSTLIILILLVPQFGCGGKPRVLSTGKVVVNKTDSRSKKIRVLLEEDFSSIEILNSSKALNILAKSSGNKIRIQEIQNGKNSDMEVDSGFRFEPVSGRYLRVNGIPYRGIVDVFINPLGSPVAVNEVDIETYLLSVVPKEMGPEQFPELEALKAQAIAARTFALSRMGSNATRGFDVFEDVRSQVYEGIRTEHALSDTAVTATRGEIAAYGGKPISCMYSSTCGGITEDFHVLFSGPPVKYLTGGVNCPDEKSPYHDWKVRIPIKTIQKNIDRLAPIGRIKKINSLEYSDHGRLRKAQFVGEKKSVTLRGNNVRFTLSVRSNYITRLKQNMDNKDYVESLDIEGHGWGHGVGLCQTGAVELASRNWGYEKILKHYYQGIQIVKYY